MKMQVTFMFLGIMYVYTMAIDLIESKEGYMEGHHNETDRRLYSVSADHFSYVQSYIMGLMLTSKISQRNGLCSNYQRMGGLSK